MPRAGSIFESRELHLGEIHIHMFLPWRHFQAFHLGQLEFKQKTGELLAGRVRRQSLGQPGQLESEGGNLRTEGAREERAPNLHINFDQILK